jgi:hypothetical protein
VTAATRASGIEGAIYAGLESLTVQHLSREWRRDDGAMLRIERCLIGQNWRMPNVHGKRTVRHVVFDTNFWKSFVHARLAVPMGDKGCLSLYGDHPDQRRLFAEHLTAEYRVKTEGRGRTVDEWKMRPERGDNHWLDCLVGCAVAASASRALRCSPFIHLPCRCLGKRSRPMPTKPHPLKSRKPQLFLSRYLMPWVR